VLRSVMDKMVSIKPDKKLAEDVNAAS
jgi:hypothetical protein